MVTKNDITGDSIQSKGVSKAYLDNYDKIFGKKDKNEVSQDPVRKGQSISSEKNSKQKEEKSP